MKYEYFLDESYYSMWAVRPVGDIDFNSKNLHHVATEKEAIKLKDKLEALK